MARIFEAGQEVTYFIKDAVGFSQNLVRKMASKEPNIPNLTG
jgi:hypothetical protein